MIKLRHVNFLFSIIVIITMISCQKQPTASFTVSNKNVKINEPVEFINTSTDAYNYIWDFGDGNQTSEYSPYHNYTIAGTFKVTLTALSKNNEKKDIVSTTIIVNDIPDEEVTISTPDKIEIELGSTDADVLFGVEASNGDKVTVTGINYDHAGEQTATFAAGDVTLDKVVCVKTSNLAGDYEYTIDQLPEILGCEIKQSNTVYNKIIISDFLGLYGHDATALCQGSEITLDPLNLELEGGETAIITGKGSFEKLARGVYQVKEMRVTVTYSPIDLVEEYVLTFEKL